MVKKFLILFGLTFTLLLAALGTFICMQVHELRPDYSGQAEIEGIQDAVSVNWDEQGVIHISGTNTADVIQAMGYATAHERLWQMELSRRLAQGQLSEVFGDTTLRIDRFFKTLGLDSISHNLYQNLSPESRQWLNWYVQGINSYLIQVKKDLPLEFILMRMQPASWSEEDCLLQGRLMAWFLNFNWKADLWYWQLASAIPDSLFREVWPHWSKGSDIISAGGLRDLYSELCSIQLQISEIMGIPLGGWGSNSWVIAPRHSKENAAMMANDPHLGLQLPSLWIEFHLISDELNVAGFSLPGSPAIIIGRNSQIAWGLTNGMIDDCDFFVEKVDSTAGTYWEGNEKIPLMKRNVHVRSGKVLAETFTVISTQRGPILNSLFPELSSSVPVSLKWVGWEMSDELNTFIKISRSENWEDFQEALKSYVVPAQNFIYSDRQGNIGYRLGGKVPVRPYPEGILARAGSVIGMHWKGWIPFEQMPRIYNPSSGLIITANNKIIESYPYYLSEYWEPPYRARRLEQLLGGEKKLTLAAMREIQMDDKNLLAQELMPVILPALWSIPDKDKQEEKMIQLLQYWDFSMDTRSIAAAIYESMQREMIGHIFRDQMEDGLFDVFTDLPNFYLRIFSRVFTREKSVWFDDIQTPEIEDRRAIVIRSFRDARNRLVSQYGLAIENWEWGNIHQLKLTHSLGQLSVMDLLLNRGPFAVPGSGCTVNVGTYRYINSFNMTAGSSLRFLVDWSQTQEYHSIIPGGNSGNFLSKFFDNQIDFWLKGELKKVSLSAVPDDKVIRLVPVK